MSQRVDLALLSKGRPPGGIAKASMNSASLYFGREGSDRSDPKPGELAMRRVNPAERRGEARTV